MHLSSLNDRPLSKFFANFFRSTNSEGIQLSLDEEGEKVIAGDVCRGGEEDGVGDSEVRFEEMDDRDDSLRFPGSRRLESDESVRGRVGIARETDSLDQTQRLTQSHRDRSRLTVV